MRIRLLFTEWPTRDSGFAAVDSNKRDDQRKKAIASCLPAFAYFCPCRRRRLLFCGRFLLQLALIVFDRGTDEIFQSALIDLVTLDKIDRAPLVAFKTRVEELVRIRKPRPIVK